MMLNSPSHPPHSKQLTNILHSSCPSLPTTTTTNLISNPSTWTTNQVEEWLIKNNLNDCVDILCHQYHMDGEHLLDLNENDLLLLTKHKQLWLKIRNLKQQFYLNNKSSYKNCQSRSSLPLPIPLRSFQTLTPVQPILNHESITISIEQSSTNSHRYTPYEQIEDELLINCCFISTIRSDRKKTFLAFLLAIISIYFCSFIITIVDERLPDPKKFPPLPDLILENIKQIPWAFAVTEKLILIEMITLISIILLHRHRMIILRRLFAIAAALYFLRSLTMIFTSLPVSTQITDCQPKKLDNMSARLKKATLIFLGQGMSSFGVKTCGDYLYSGHTCTLVLATHFINEYTPRSYHLLHILSWLTALSGMFFILAGHQHYSIDILIAWVLTSRLFVYYHTLANNPAFLQRDKNRMRIWFPFFSYFEANIKTAIPNEYYLPDFVYELRAMINNSIETIRYSAFWFIVFLFIIITYSLSFTKKSNFSSLIE